ncbi:MAG: nucleoside triphosphate pyrophosphohydrolase [Planctomycetota bacterium]
MEPKDRSSDVSDSEAQSLEQQAGAALQQLKGTVDRLRSPGGCPWDLEQTPTSLTPYLLEEAHETVEAIERGDSDGVREELGDLLLNVFLQARIAEEENTFTLAAVADGIREKLIRRHPHVFGEAIAEDADAVRQQWEEIKQREKPEREPARTLRDLPASLPALEQGERLGAMAAEVGFDWPDQQGPVAKIDEEVAELKDALAAGDPAQVEAEIGDLLLAITSVCRHTGVRSEAALRGALQRFRTRFEVIEERLTTASEPVPLADLEAWWQEAKRAQSEDS